MEEMGFLSNFLIILFVFTENFVSFVFTIVPCPELNNNYGSKTIESTFN